MAGVAGAVLLLDTTWCLAAPISFTTVTLTGAPGEPGPELGSSARFIGFTDGVSLNPDAQIALRASAAGATLEAGTVEGIWLTTGGELAPVALSGVSNSLGPQLNGVRFSSFTNSPIINAQGHFAFEASLTGDDVTSANNRGIWSNTLGFLFPVVRTGTSNILGPQLGADVVFSWIGAPTLSESGDVAFRAFLRGFPVDSSNHEGIWSGATATIEPVARTGIDGALGPQLGANVWFTSLSGAPAINAFGEVAFRGTLAGVGVQPGASDVGVWCGVAGDIKLIARTGVTGTLGPRLGSGVRFSNLLDPSINAEGDLAFAGRLAGSNVTAKNNNGVWVGQPGQHQALARTGTDGPLGPQLGPSVVFSSFNFFSIVLNATGKVAFVAKAQLDDTGNVQTTQGLWLGKPGALELIARTNAGGAKGPQLGSNIVFTSISQPAVNALGQVAFVGAISGPGVSTQNNLGIWVTDALGNIAPVVRTGDTLYPAHGAGRTVSMISLRTGSGGEDGRRWSFNDDAKLTFWARFTDDTEGVFLAHVPMNASCRADLNFDGVVDGADLGILLSNWGSCPAGSTPCIADLTGNGDVGGADLGVLLSSWGYCSGQALHCPADLNGDGAVDAYDLVILLNAWGQSESVADLNNDGVVNAMDLVILLNAWGACH